MSAELEPISLKTIESNVDIAVSNSGLIRPQIYRDPPDGNLHVVESHLDVPFAIQRNYYINKLGNPKAVRGKHAHKSLEQVIYCIQGRFLLLLDDGVCRQNILMDTSEKGIYLGPSLWHEMTKFSRNCVIWVVASQHYNKDDYIRNYDLFLEWIYNGA